MNKSEIVSLLKLEDKADLEELFYKARSEKEKVT